jgi:hypothetical protein
MSRLSHFPIALSVVGMLGLAGCGKDDNKLKVTSLDPSEGDYASISYTHVYGSHFTTDSHGASSPANAKIYFGNLQGRITRFVGDDEMVAEVPGAPDGKPETVDVLIIFEGRGEIRLPKGFTFIEKRGPSKVDQLKTK